MEIRLPIPAAILAVVVIFSIPLGIGIFIGRAKSVHVHDVTDSIVHNPDDNTLSFNGTTLECQKPSEWRIK